MISDLIFKIGYKMSTSSWPMFLLRTLDGSEMAPATFFKEVRKELKRTSISWAVVLFFNGILKYFVFSNKKKQKCFLNLVVGKCIY